MVLGAVRTNCQDTPARTAVQKGNREPRKPPVLPTTETIEQPPTPATLSTAGKKAGSYHCAGAQGRPCDSLARGGGGEKRDDAHAPGKTLR